MENGWKIFFFVTSVFRESEAVSVGPFLKYLKGTVVTTVSARNGSKVSHETACNRKSLED